ncbi:DUF2735 domain-containing protein [Rhizobium sp. CC-YZS058]|uniref:DUF2735 domain-containing protein n=1 Tax=Rhizobium sp. CC-YZS058 TaxID=3042153 RepID=UPI002B06164C|nr:DUF2735 domain-containing protein [Rhizobium sp. CC-YZS058]MEA3534582.1 DUF2735 domain-containing protein [Rhizobium sp. CC-YZS058]
MPIINERHSATILQFPLGGLKGAGHWKARREADLQVDDRIMIIDTCWYHEEAMRETTPQKN